MSAASLDATPRNLSRVFEFIANQILMRPLLSFANETIALDNEGFLVASSDQISNVNCKNFNLRVLLVEILCCYKPRKTSILKTTNHQLKCRPIFVRSRFEQLFDAHPLSRCRCFYCAFIPTQTTYIFTDASQKCKRFV